MGISLGVVAGLVNLIGDGVLGGRGARAEGRVAVLGDRLVGLLGCLSTGTLDGLRDVVGGVLCERKAKSAWSMEGVKK